MRLPRAKSRAVFEFRASGFAAGWAFLVHEMSMRQKARITGKLQEKYISSGIREMLLEDGLPALDKAPNSPNPIGAHLRARSRCSSR
jgi:hypothetical protein